jgi:glycosyltransferase involved in cell wall biosynthesis
LSGVGQYVYQLSRELERVLPQAMFFAYGRLPRDRLALPSEAWVTRVETNAQAGKVPSFLWLRTRGAQLCRRDRLDVFWAGRTLHPGLGRSCHTISTVHDLNHLIVPNTMQPTTRWSHRLWFERDVQSAQTVVANSYGTARRLNEMLAREARVIRPGLDARFTPPAPGAARSDLAALAEVGVVPPYLLCVATLEPRKNLEVAFRAFMRLRASGVLTQHKLVVAGPDGWVNRTFERELAGAVEAGIVVRTGYLPDPLLPALYAAADLVMLPSLYEGFGMPALEARACGARVLVSSVPELVEAGGPACTRAAPTIDGIAHGIVESLQRSHEVEDATALHEQFSWARGAESLASIMLG